MKRFIRRRKKRRMLHDRDDRKCFDCGANESDTDGGINADRDPTGIQPREERDREAYDPKNIAKANEVL